MAPRILALLLLAGLPLLGLLCARISLEPYMEFPPRSLYVEHAPYSPTVFAIGLALALALSGALAVAARGEGRGRPGTSPPTKSFPFWGWAALAGLLLSWVLAWTRYAWFTGLQAYTYTPIWLCFIILVNAHTWYRSGHCLLLDRRRLFLSLFPVSTVFWWYFEYLNRFVQNWHYLGTGEFTAATYLIHSSIAFSTVLPAVMSVLEWLLRSSRHRYSRRGPRLLPGQGRATALLVLGTACLSLFLIGIYPDLLFPLLWLSPLLVIVSLQVLLGTETIFMPLRRGDWRVLNLPALAALTCGICWEMWNYHSMAKWIYLIPYVDHWHVFEMPLVGYLGYLPFGLECLVISDLLWRTMTGGSFYDSIAPSPHDSTPARTSLPDGDSD